MIQLRVFRSIVSTRNNLKCFHRDSTSGHVRTYRVQGYGPTISSLHCLGVQNEDPRVVYSRGVVLNWNE